MESNKVLLPTVTGLRSYQASIMAKKYLETGDWEEVRLSSNNDNIFDASRSSTSNRYVHNLIKLMKNLNKDQLELIASGEEKDRLTFLWLGFCLAYSIVGEFASTVICKKVMNKDFKLKAEDLWEFIADKAVEHEDLADISKAVRSKFKCVVFYNLRDVGYLNSVDEIQYARLSKEARDLIDDEYISFFPGGGKMKILNPYVDKSSEVQTYIEDLLKKDTFRKMVHAGAEIPNYILPYPIKMNDCYLRMAENVVKRLGNEGVEVQLINLYETMLAIIGNDLEDYFAADMSKDDMFQDFSNILDLNNSFLPYIANQMDGSSAEIVIFSGIGEAYPFVRIHSLLEAIPTKVKTKKPIVVFYPGSYDHSTGNSCFRLFGKLDSVNYYRAYNIFSEVM